MFPGETFAAVAPSTKRRPEACIVIDSGAAERGVSWGGTATFAASRKGLAGLVTNGTVRDLAEMLERKFPIFATGTSLVAGLRGHPGWLNIPISIGEVVVHPGDFVVGDLDGVVVVPVAQFAEVARRAVGATGSGGRKRAEAVAGRHFDGRVEVGLIVLCAHERTH